MQFNKLLWSSFVLWFSLNASAAKEFPPAPIHFVYDESIEYGQHLSRLIDKVNPTYPPQSTIKISEPPAPGDFEAIRGLILWKFSLQWQHRKHRDTSHVSWHCSGFAACPHTCRSDSSRSRSDPSRRPATGLASRYGGQAREWRKGTRKTLQT